MSNAEKGTEKECSDSDGDVLLYLYFNAYGLKLDENPLSLSNRKPTGIQEMKVRRHRCMTCDMSNKASIYYLQIFILSRSGYLLTYIPTAVKRMLKRRPRRGRARCRTTLRHLSTFLWNLHNVMFLHLLNTLYVDAY